MTWATFPRKCAASSCVSGWPSCPRSLRGTLYTKVVSPLRGTFCVHLFRDWEHLVLTQALTMNHFGLNLNLSSQELTHFVFCPLARIFLNVVYLQCIYLNTYIYFFYNIPFFHLHSRIDSYAGGTSGKEPAWWYRGPKRSSLIPVLQRSPGGRHNNPPQYFCLKNLMDRGAWQSMGLQRVINYWSDLVHMHTCSLFYIISSCKTWWQLNVIFIYFFIEE